MRANEMSSDLQDCVEPDRSGVLASPMFWIGALASLGFWVAVALLLVYLF